MLLRFSGKLGIAEQVEKSPGNWAEVITEQDVIGDLEQKTEALDSGDEVLPRYRTTTSVSVFATGLEPQDNSMLRYLKYGEKRWTIATIVNRHPKILLYFGEEYHGPIPE